MRKAWSDARDKQLGLKKGAVKGISLGDEIDKVGKVSGKGYATMAAALNKLKPVLVKYVAGLPKGSDKAKAWIKKTQQDAVEDDLKAIAEDLKQLAWVQKEMIDDVVAPINSAHPDSGMLPNVNRLIESKPGTTWEAAAKAIGLLDISGKVVAINAKRFAALSKLAWKAKLPGMEPQYKAIEAYQAPFKADILFYGKWAAVKTADEFFAFMKSSRQRTTSLESFDDMRKAAGALRG